MKGIEGEWGHIKIPFKSNMKHVKKRPYRLNPKYKEIVKEEIDKMLQEGTIEPIEESKWISLIVIQKKKIGGIRLCVDIKKLNDACITNALPTLFIDEVLESVGFEESYSFTDGFLGYHQIKIAKGDQHKTTFSIEWGSY